MHALLLALKLHSLQPVVQKPHQQILPQPQQQLMHSQKKHPQQITLSTIEQQQASVQHLSTQMLASGHSDTWSSVRCDVCGEHRN